MPDFRTWLAKVPLKIGYDAPPGYRTALSWWWRLTDNVFRFVQWCIVLGLVKYVATRTNGVILSIIAAGLEFLLLWLLLKGIAGKPMVTITAPKLPRRLRTVLETALVWMIAAVPGIGGYTVLRSVEAALGSIQPLH